MEKFSFNIPGIDFDPILFILFVIFPMVAALLCLYTSFRFLKRARSIEDMPYSKIRSAAQGYVAFKGKVEPLGYLVNGELSQKPCIWYRYRIDELKTYYNENNEAILRWEPISQGASHHPFLINDDTGKCVVIPDGAEMITQSTLRWYGNTIPPRSYPEPSFWNLFFGSSGRFCYLEQRIEDNTDVYATGMFYTLQKNNEFLQENIELKQYLEETKTSYVNILNNTGLGQKQSLLISSHPEKKVVWEYKIKAFLFFLSFLFFAMMIISASYRVVMQSVHTFQHRL